MTDRDRLIRTIETAKAKWEGGTNVIDHKIADEILADGWIKPPCKVGDKVYLLTNKNDGSPKEVIEGVVQRIVIETDNSIWLAVTFGIWYGCKPYTDFYFNKEEAEKALKECEGK